MIRLLDLQNQMRFSGTIVLIFTSTLKAHPIRRRALAPILFFCLVFLFPATFLNTNTFQNFFPTFSLCESSLSIRNTVFYKTGNEFIMVEWIFIYLEVLGTLHSIFFNYHPGTVLMLLLCTAPYTCSIDKEDVSKQESRPIFNFLN